MAVLVISYARVDRERVRECVALLRAALLVRDAVFWDEDFEPGRDWQVQFEAALQGSPSLFVFWCAHAAQSPQVAREVRYALGKRKRVIPVLIDHTELQRRLKKVQAIDMRRMFNHDLADRSAPLALSAEVVDGFREGLRAPEPTRRHWYLLRLAPLLLAPIVFVLYLNAPSSSTRFPETGPQTSAPVPPATMPEPPPTILPEPPPTSPATPNTAPGPRTTAPEVPTTVPGLPATMPAPPSLLGFAASERDIEEWSTALGYRSYELIVGTGPPDRPKFFQLYRRDDPEAQRVQLTLTSTHGMGASIVMKPDPAQMAQIEQLRPEAAEALRTRLDLAAAKFSVKISTDDDGRHRLYAIDDDVDSISQRRFVSLLSRIASAQDEWRRELAAELSKHEP